jgi:hypothetical protein
MSLIKSRSPDGETGLIGNVLSGRAKKNKQKGRVMLSLKKMNKS